MKNELSIEKWMLFCVVSCMENASELGCPKDKSVDMWIRELEIDKPKDALKVMKKLKGIMKRELVGSCVPKSK